MKEKLKKTAAGMLWLGAWGNRILVEISKWTVIGMSVLLVVPAEAPLVFQMIIAGAVFTPIHKLAKKVVEPYCDAAIDVADWAERQIKKTNEDAIDKKINGVDVLINKVREHAIHKEDDIHTVIKKVGWFAIRGGVLAVSCATLGTLPIGLFNVSLMAAQPMIFSVEMARMSDTYEEEKRRLELANLSKQVTEIVKKNNGMGREAERDMNNGREIERNNSNNDRRKIQIFERADITNRERRHSIA